MRYTQLLFDLDDTLLDFAANEAVALETLFQRQGYPLTEETLSVYRTVNKGLWRDYEDGRIPLDRVLNTRFSETLKGLGIAVDGAGWEALYRALLGEGHQLIPGASAVCQELSRTHRLFVVTNGVHQTQLKRLERAGLRTYFEAVFDSESIGAQKPAPAFFEHVARHIPGFDPKSALVIGDSLNTDIKGGTLAGIDTCWFNRKGQENTVGVTSTYTITELGELMAICA